MTAPLYPQGAADPDGAGQSGAGEPLWARAGVYTRRVLERRPGVPGARPDRYVPLSLLVPQPEAQ